MAIICQQEQTARKDMPHIVYLKLPSLPLFYTSNQFNAKLRQECFL
jgi:hypothetical protein